MTSPVQPLRLPLLLPALASWAAAAWSVGRSPSAGAALAGASGCVAAVAGTVTARHRRTTGHGTPAAGATIVCLVACAVVVTSASAAAGVAVRGAGPVTAWAADRAVASIEATVTGPAHRVASRWSGQPRWLLTVQASSVAARGATWHGDVTLTVLAPEPWSMLAPGSSVRGRGRLSPTAGPQRAVATMTTSRPPTDVTPPVSVWQTAEDVRSGLRRAVADGDPDAKGLLPALVDGDTSAVPPDLQSAMRAVGLTHLTAVSGANLAVVLGAVLGAATALRLPRPVRVVLGFGTLAACVIVARPQPSVLRAAGMGGVLLIGLWSGRRARGLHALTAAAVVLLAWDPWLSRSFGFSLSILATGALLTLAPILVDLMPARLPRLLRTAVAVPVSAQVVTAPVVLLLQPGIPLVGVPANILAAPAAAVATVSGAAAAALSPVLPPAATLAARPGLLAASVIAHVARTAAAIPASRIPWPQGTSGAWAAALGSAGCVAAVLALVGRRPSSADPEHPGRTATQPPARTPRRHAGENVRAQRRPGRTGPRRRQRLLAGGLGAATALAAGWAVAPRVPILSPAVWPPSEWLVVQCDVGQGSATVVRTGPGSAVLLDAGPVPDLVDRCLRRLAVRRLDLVVLTHFHGDHVLGLPGALRGRVIRGAVVSPLAQPEANARQVDAWLASANVVPTLGWAGLSGVAGPSGAGVRWRTLSPRPPLPGTAPGDGPDDDEGTRINDASTSVVMHVGGHTIAVLGDLEEAGQSAVLRGWPLDVRFVDVVTVAHHGSAHQLPALYARLHAAVALIGVGANDYGHPSRRTTSMVRSTGAVLARTDDAGDVAVTGGPDGSLTVAGRRARNPTADGTVGGVWQAEPRATSPPFPVRSRPAALRRRESRRRAGRARGSAGRPRRGR